MTFACVECQTPVVKGNWANFLQCPKCRIHFLMNGENVSMKFHLTELRHAKKGMHIIRRESGRILQIYDVKPSPIEGYSFIAIENIGGKPYSKNKQEWLSKD